MKVFLKLVILVLQMFFINAMGYSQTFNSNDSTMTPIKPLSKNQQLIQDNWGYLAAGHARNNQYTLIEKKSPVTPSSVNAIAAKCYEVKDAAVTMIAFVYPSTKKMWDMYDNYWCHKTPFPVGKYYLVHNHEMVIWVYSKYKDEDHAMIMSMLTLFFQLAE